VLFEDSGSSDAAGKPAIEGLWRSSKGFSQPQKDAENIKH
jgi:hypothetical protein